MTPVFGIVPTNLSPPQLNTDRLGHRNKPATADTRRAVDSKFETMPGRDDYTIEGNLFIDKSESQQTPCSGIACTLRPRRPQLHFVCLRRRKARTPRSRD